MKAVILTYHSHHVLAAAYGLNDHVAFPIDLELVTQAGYRIVPLDRIVERLHAEQQHHADAYDNVRYVGLTFDDGPVYDFDDFVHPRLGLQRSFVNAMRDFADSALGYLQPELHATSFVIASPEAREIMETTFDAEYTYLGSGSMGDDWWSRAIATGLLSIANHSWDHLHPALPRVAHSRQARADFTQVESDEDADAQILAASRFIDEKTEGRASPFFAYPFGHVNDFLSMQYLPRKGTERDVRAAFTTEPRPIASSDSAYALPRYTCGHHWKSPEQLMGILGRQQSSSG